jgi:hypothetical protein
MATLSNNGPTITNQFSMEFAFTQTTGSSGYLIAKTNAIGQRYFALYSTPSVIYFFYNRQGSSLSTVNFVSFSVSVSDGLPHRLLLAVNGTSAALYLDWLPVGQANLVGPISDCGAASSSCYLTLGGRRGSSPGYFSGTMSEAQLFTAKVLQWVYTTTAPLTNPPQTTTTPAPYSSSSAYLIYSGLGLSYLVMGARPYSIFGFYVVAVNDAGTVASDGVAIQTPEAGELYTIYTVDC